jgi:hypothetical protein
MNVRSYAAAMVAVCLFSSLTVLAQPAKKAHNTEVENDIREAVLRYQILNWAQEGDGAFFISIDGKDPSDSFMKRFVTFPRRVEKLSHSGIERNATDNVIDKATGHWGVIFRVEQIRWRGANSVEVEGGYCCGGLCASGETFNLHRKKGIWTVIGSAMQWIS